MNRRSAVAIALALLAILVIAGASREPYRGNTRSRVFHRSSCQHYTCPHCTATFKTPQDAIDQGYRACRICRPASAEAATAARAGYVGNTSSRKFHRTSCQHARCKNCTAKFKSRDDAIAAGYVAGRCCNP